ncbi:LOW QUALITY PROTEIN: hypothetical protein HID58_058757 [Brassica napus]|uniref:Uncharacterized protein n=1 Tax=Brassica napus TaxID=3708 RepID=A0ABQ7ZQZ0_BRANA|nr:LOW QUALITY PROTEIN: hypothetical protein HID58_058757 [Brassica napus]
MSFNVRFEWNFFGMLPERFVWEMVRETIFEDVKETGDRDERHGEVSEVNETSEVESWRPLRRRRNEETAEKEWNESGRRGHGEDEVRGVGALRRGRNSLSCAAPNFQGLKGI